VELGFDTVGNATIIAHDCKPVLATDPWIDAPAYFGSWGLAHEIPAEQREALKSVEYVWLSHGHPDHLNGDSLPNFKHRKILLPDHRGGRIKVDLDAQGFNTAVLKTREWMRLSDRIRVQCLPDENQDAVLLIEMGGDTLLVNMNDATPDVRGWGTHIRKLIKNYRRSFLFRLSGYGDADMINLWTEDGKRILPSAAKKRPVPPMVRALTESYEANYFVPSSSMHRYQRSDSVWANEYTTPVEVYANGFDSKKCELLPAYVRYDLLKGDCTPLRPQAMDAVVIDHKQFGDDWSETLSGDEKQRATKYFQAVEHLSAVMDFVRLKIGGEETTIPLRNSGFKKGLTFEVPRKSFMTAVDYEFFDDLLIGNFMKVTFNGKWPESGLHPDFTPYVAKFADNGRAKTKAELAAYRAHYRSVVPLSLPTLFRNKAMRLFTSVVPRDSDLYELGKRAYFFVRRV
jgi:hypothetical protein